MKKEKPKIEVEELDEELFERVSEAIQLDALVRLLKKKKLITQKELENSMFKEQKEAEEFAKSNPGIMESIQEQFDAKEEEVKEDMGNYIG